jgi:hypothetical protein
MPPQHTPASRRLSSVQPGVKNVFGREPLLIPPRADARPRPWFRRRAVVVPIVLLVTLAIVAGAWGFGAGSTRTLASIFAR